MHIHTNVGVESFEIKEIFTLLYSIHVILGGEPTWFSDKVPRRNVWNRDHPNQVKCTSYRTITELLFYSKFFGNEFLAV